jgi:hypothetical protein
MVKGIKDVKAYGDCKGHKGNKLLDGTSCSPECHDGYKLTQKAECSADGIYKPPVCSLKCDISKITDIKSVKDYGDCKKNAKNDILSDGTSCTPICDNGYLLTQKADCSKSGIYKPPVCSLQKGSCDISSLFGPPGKPANKYRATTKAGSVRWWSQAIVIPGAGCPSNYILADGSPPCKPKCPANQQRLAADDSGISCKQGKRAISTDSTTVDKIMAGLDAKKSYSAQGFATIMKQFPGANEESLCFSAEMKKK